ncbi:MAG: Hg(II)-responsive transcriptional regulator [Candidatus Omnitrophica bacterium CG11_big_fil_rev_8_21_14_0_20_45_26]|uniref:Hg(II)-responsive transcriptional regulator n=1 Tax=Candidatus Abzuiibacterium crystallinum TaxID=1974748 RepID=A0A2H0LNU2_9BACT|nr:MAG: Hg(II)-responsive transcriptional regulator [Candidatus Omnitrophica bacterium CG11_big_fil_rev_8_21_14_0_20_45_26]PIW65305.1 MAG: Hg(II)-responsive transcriptional regulator [Candidatus Omnitrophica bacterium CG12_big_fil_rev_8_21_14_0_65_45_16]
MESKKELRQIGDVANESSVSIDAIRYYEKLGLVEKPIRSEGGFRLYPRHVVEKLRFIRKAQSFGITLSEIKEIIRQSERGLESCCNHVGKLFRRKLKEFEIKMKELQRMRRGLKNMMKQWIPLEQAKKRHYAVCPQIETERPKRKRGKRHGKKKS